MVKTVYQDALKPIAAFENPIATISTPASGVNNNLLCISADWLPALRGALGVLLEPIHWKGTQEEIDYSIQQVAEIIFMASPACDCIADCIINNPTVIQNIEYIDTGNPLTPLPAAELSRNLLDDITACELDRIYAACEYCIDAIFDATNEVFQRINAVTSPYKQIGELVQGIPIIGGIGNLAAVAFWVTEYGGIVFTAADSESVRFNLACQLYCKAAIDCKITLDMIQEVFDANAISGMPSYLDVFAFVDWLITNVLGGDPALATATSIAQLGLHVIKHGGKLGEFAFGLVSLEQTILIGSQNPTTEYLACAACPNIAVVRFNDPGDATYELYSLLGLPVLPTLELTGGNPDAYVLNSQQYDANYGGTQYESTIRIDLGAEYNIESIRFDWKYGSSSRQVARTIEFENGAGNFLSTINETNQQSANVWNSQSFPALTEPGVRYIIVSVGNSTQITPVPAWTLGLDNVIVVYS